MKWSIAEGASGGEISAAGAYVAPETDGDYHVVATSNQDPTKSATAEVSVAANAFTATGNLLYSRTLHTATLLSDGQVVIAGGDGANGVEAHVEEFDPVQGKFHITGSVMRVYHTATLLKNGDVLFAGGSNSQSTPGSNSAELFNPVSESIQPTGSMLLARRYHTATLLDDGRVLITGGMVPNGSSESPTATAELYDPATGTFSQAANMNEERAFHSATLLPDGKVLVIGDGSAEIYDPTTDSFTLTSNAPAARFASVATALADGRVLITGGATDYNDLYAGPSEIFDPGTGQFTPTGALLAPRTDHTATLLADGRVLVAGGFSDPEADYPDNDSEIYDPATGSFSPGPNMLGYRADHTTTLLSDGSVLIVGSWNSSGTAEIFK